MLLVPITQTCRWQVPVGIAVCSVTHMHEKQAACSSAGKLQHPTNRKRPSQQAVMMTEIRPCVHIWAQTQRTVYTCTAGCP